MRVCNQSTIDAIASLWNKKAYPPSMRTAISDAVNGKPMSRKRENRLRDQLGVAPLPTLYEIEECPDCGKLHYARCNGNTGAVVVLGECQRVSNKRAPKPYHRIADMPVEVLARSIQNRVHYGTGSLAQTGH